MVDCCIKPGKHLSAVGCRGLTTQNKQINSIECDQLRTGRIRNRYLTSPYLAAGRKHCLASERNSRAGCRIQAGKGPTQAWGAPMVFITLYKEEKMELLRGHLQAASTRIGGTTQQSMLVTGKAHAEHLEYLATVCT